MICLLCNAVSRPSGPAHGRFWFDCGNCGLVFAHPEDVPRADEERARYLTHENDPDDPGYRAFLDRVAIPLVERLSPGDRGLDYGSGPGPTLSVMLTERGFPTVVWDPFFAPDPAVLEHTWDFVTCTETVEHFHHPAAEYARLAALVRPGGLLAIMTQPLSDATPLVDWWYARDPTHVALHRDRTFEWLAERYGWELERPSPTVAIYRMPARSGSS